MNAKVSIHVWRADGRMGSFGTVWVSQPARDALVRRVLGEGVKVETTLTVPVDDPQIPLSLRPGWERNATKSGAVLAIGLAAL